MDASKKGSLDRGGGCGGWHRASWRVEPQMGCKAGGMNWPQGCKQDSISLHGVPGACRFPTELLVGPSVPVHLPADFEVDVGKGLAVWRCFSVRTSGQHRLRPDADP